MAARRFILAITPALVFGIGLGACADIWQFEDIQSANLPEDGAVGASGSQSDATVASPDSGSATPDVSAIPEDTSCLAMCGGQCADITRDPTNCGMCYARCPNGATCVASACVCAAGGTLCNSGAQCVDLTSDHDNCGACNRACPAAATCTMGACGCTSVTAKMCNGSCADTASDSNNCGGCGNACTGAKVCTNSACVPCNHTNCSGQCVDTSADPKNCGSCGTACGATATCVASHCAASIVDGGREAGRPDTGTDSASDRGADATLAEAGDDATSTSDATQSDDATVGDDATTGDEVGPEAALRDEPAADTATE